MFNSKRLIRASQQFDAEIRGICAAIRQCEVRDVVRAAQDLNPSVPAAMLRQQACTARQRIAADRLRHMMN